MPVVTARGRLGLRVFRGAAAWLLVALILVTLAVNLWWLHHFRAGYPLDIDESRYLAFGLELHDRLRSAGLTGLWHAWAGQHDFGPLLPLVSVPLYAVFGRAIMTGLATQLLFLVVLVLSSYGICSRLASRTAGTVAALVVASTPAVVDFGRTYQFAVTDAAVLTAATYALLQSEAFSRRGWSCIWGLLVGLGPLSRTMAIAFVPAQLAAAVWLAAVRPGRGRTCWQNLALALVVSLLSAATWLATSWHSVYAYLTNFGYGAHSTYFGHPGSRLTVGYWTREAVALVRDDLYLPLAALLALAFALGASAWLVTRRGAMGRERVAVAARAWTRTDAAIALFIMLEGYVAVSSSRNEGVGFRLPLIGVLVALTVATAANLPWRWARRVLLSALVAVSALNLVMKADVIRDVSNTVTANLPGLGLVPLLSGQGYIQTFVLSSSATPGGPSTQPLPVAVKEWLPTYGRIVRIATEVTARRHTPTLVALATDEPLLNANNLVLAARLGERRNLTVNLLPGPPGPATVAAYRKLVVKGNPTVIITVSYVSRSYFAVSGLKDTDQGLLERVSTGLGFRCAGAVRLPDGREAILASRPGLATAGSPGSCAPRVIRVDPSDGSVTAATTAPIAALFSAPMDAKSLRRAFALRQAKNGRLVAGTVSPFGETALLFKPARALHPNTTYTATIGRSATAATGTSARNTTTWSFTTAG